MTTAKYEVFWGVILGEIFSKWRERMSKFWVSGGNMSGIQDICQLLPKYVQKLTL